MVESARMSSQKTNTPPAPSLAVVGKSSRCGTTHTGRFEPESVGHAALASLLQKHAAAISAINMTNGRLRTRVEATDFT
jgi:hypothetical protein